MKLEGQLVALLLSGAMAMIGMTATGVTEAHAAPSAPRAAAAPAGGAQQTAQNTPSDAPDEEEGEGGAPGDGDPLTTPDGQVPNASEEEPVEDEKAELESRVQELEDIVQELERKAAVQRLGWSADYRVTLSSFRYEGDAIDGSRNPDGTRKQVTLKNTEQWTHRVRLAIQADPTPKLRFRARLVAFKRFGDTSFTPLVDGAQGRVPHDASARFDRFWLDWFVTDKLSFSLGRISTTDGSPAELRENLERPAATVSLGFVDSEYDAIAMTYQLGPVLFRASYLSWQFQNPDDTFGLLPFLAKDSIPVRIYGVSFLLRSENNLLPTAEVSAYVNPEFRSVYPIAGIPGPDGTPIKPSYTPRSFGAMGAGTLLLLWRDLVPGLDMFGSGSISFADPNGKAIEYPLGPNGENVPVLALVSSDSDDHLGYHAYGGVRYTLPVGGEHAPKLGFETTYGSRYLVTFTTPTSDLVTRIGVRGHTYDVYAIQPIYGNLFARLSYTLIDYNYAPPIGGGLGFVEAYGGTAPPANRTIQGVNAMLHATF